MIVGLEHALFCQSPVYSTHVSMSEYLCFQYNTLFIGVVVMQRW